MDAIDSLVRRHDEDRWLASRFAESNAVRRRLIAIYAINYEIARTPETVTQGAIGDIRLAWWREALAEIHGGKPARAHPTLQAYAEAAHDAQPPLDAWERLIEARGRDLDAAPFATLVELDVYLAATAGGVMRLALAACGASVDEAALSAAARAWGYVGLLRAEPHWRARGRSFLPGGASLDDIAARANEAHAELARTRLSTQGFPALGYVALAPGYLRALRQARRERALLPRQLRLIAASATGRL